MDINYTIMTIVGQKVSEGQFNTNDRPAVRQFAQRADAAWIAGHIVTTVADDAIARTKR